MAAYWPVKEVFNIKRPKKITVNGQIPQKITVKGSFKKRSHPMRNQKAYEADGFKFTLNMIDEDLSSFEFFEVLAREVVGRGEPITGTATLVGSEIDIAFAPWQMTPGEWRIQVRVGATEADAKTAWAGWAGNWSILDSIAEKP